MFDIFFFFKHMMKCGSQIKKKKKNIDKDVCVIKVNYKALVYKSVYNIGFFYFWFSINKYLCLTYQKRFARFSICITSDLKVYFNFKKKL